MTNMFQVHHKKYEIIRSVKNNLTDTKFVIRQPSPCSINVCRVVHVRIQVFLNSALLGGELLASCSRRFTAGERAPGSHYIGGWVGPGTGLDGVERGKFLLLTRLELRSLVLPVHMK
jgi:hypothetical protein